jgi:hypothetical protein
MCRYGALSEMIVIAHTWCSVWGVSGRLVVPPESADIDRSAELGVRRLGRPSCMKRRPTRPATPPPL